MLPKCNLPSIQNERQRSRHCNISGALVLQRRVAPPVVITRIKTVRSPRERNPCQEKRSIRHCMFPCFNMLPKKGTPGGRLPKMTGHANTPGKNAQSISGLHRRDPAGLHDRRWAEPRWPNLDRRWREGGLSPTPQEHRLVFLWHRAVHDGAVAVSFH